MSDKGHLKLAPLLSKIRLSQLVELYVIEPSSFVVLVKDLKLLLKLTLNEVEEGLFVHSFQVESISIGVTQHATCFDHKLGDVDDELKIMWSEDRVGGRLRHALLFSALQMLAIEVK